MMRTQVVRWVKGLAQGAGLAMAVALLTGATAGCGNKDASPASSASSASGPSYLQTVLSWFSSKTPPPPTPTPAPVTVTTAQRKTVPLQYATFGTVQAKLSSAIKSQVTGLLDKIHFKEGEDVKEGQTLFTIDPKWLDAALAQAEANLARDEAQHKNALKEAEREEELLKKGVVAPDVSETARTTADALDATIKADKALIDSAKTQLSYCTIKSPIDGRMGQWLLDQGNLVKPNDQTLAVINQIKPIEVAFSVPQRLLQTIKDERPKHKLLVQAAIPGQDGRPILGELTFVDNTVDASTGTIVLKATFDNEDSRLWPGEYVKVVLTLRDEPDSVVIPTRAIQTGQDNQYVFVVKEGPSVEMRPVTIERTLDGDSVISKGLDGRETVVTDGQIRLVDGSKIVIKAAPAAKASEEDEGDEPDTKAPVKKASAGKSEGGRP